MEMSLFQPVRLCLIAVALLLCARGSWADPVPTHPARLVKAINPHLHMSGIERGSAPALKPAKPPASPAPHFKVARVEVARRTWTRRVNIFSYIHRHRGLSTIVGVVRDASGRPHAGVRVSLRKPGGRIFAIVARRHVTMTSAGGRFVMANVRPGSYRVLAAIVRNNKIMRSSHARQGVHAGDVVHVNLVL
jgi:hypothetical protein